MKYKIIKGTELFEQLTDLKNRMNEANNVALDLAIKLGGKSVATTGNNLAGGIDAIEFDKQPEGWKSVGRSYQRLYYPKASNKAILKEISELPKIKISELNKLVCFERGQIVGNGRGLSWVHSVGMMWHKDFILMKTAEGTKYNPIHGVVEILGSEYDELAKLIINKK